MGSVRSVERVFSPLDKELGLVPGGMTPHAQECLVRLGTWLPFAPAGQMLQLCLGVQVSEATVRRDTEAAGAAYDVVQTAEVEQLEREPRPAPAGPAKQLVSVDGAMVPLVGGAWAEVKTMALGVIGPAVRQGAEWVVHTDQLSYFSRLAPAEDFRRLAVAEVQRRGVENAGQVVAVMDGAEWEQHFVDFHCPAAVRILDFPHAAERLSAIGDPLWGQDTPTSREWFERQAQRLKQAGPTPMLAELRALQAQHPTNTVLADNRAYLEKREAQMHYPEYQAQGWPIGRGAVESANKVVVEARLKGAGKHWAPPHVNPMLALRDLVCNDRWEEGWPQLTDQLRHQQARRRAALKQSRRRSCPPPIAADGASPPPASPAAAAAPLANAQPDRNATAPPKGPYRPGPNHPWRHSGIGRARFQPYRRYEPPKN
jgi:hypothetical protein